MLLVQGTRPLAIRSRLLSTRRETQRRSVGRLATRGKRTLLFRVRLVRRSACASDLVRGWSWIGDAVPDAPFQHRSRANWGARSATNPLLARSRENLRHGRRPAFASRHASYAAASTADREGQRRRDRRVGRRSGTLTPCFMPLLMAMTLMKPVAAKHPHRPPACR